MKQARDKTNIPSGERGAAVVELALLLPLLTILILGLIDLGLIVREHQILQNAAREGARFSALPQNNKLNKTTTEQAQIDTDIKARVTAYAQGERITIDPNNITIDQSFLIPTGSSTEHGSQIVVLYNRSLLFSGSPYLTLGTVTLRGESVFENLYGN
jgi:Flp pilus assembly protein TadG